MRIPDMIQPQLTSLFFAPMKTYVEAKILSLTPEMADLHIHGEWWSDDALEAEFDPMPIDRFWDWNTLEIEREGRILASERIAILAGEERPVQGAMMISTEPVDSVLEPGQQGLFVELLFTAPQNRPMLRKDKLDFFKSVGITLLTWAAGFSREHGYRGRLLLDGSPDYLGWYRKRGLQTLGLEPIVYQGVKYTPMELPIAAAEKLLAQAE
jgi:hypothetical protein